MPAVTLPALAFGPDQSSVPVRDWPIGDVPFWSELHANSQFGHSERRFGDLGSGGP